jgi:hypothetical protein
MTPYEKLTEAELKILLRAIDRDVSASLRNGCWDQLSDYMIYVYKNDQFVFDPSVIIELDKIIKRFQSAKEIIIQLKNISGEEKNARTIKPDYYFSEIFHPVANNIQNLAYRKREEIVYRWQSRKKKINGNNKDDV